MADENSEVRVTLRLPGTLHAILTHGAMQNQRSMNAEIIARLERSVNFEDEYGTLETVMREVWKDIDELKSNVDELGRHVFPQRYDWK